MRAGAARLRRFQGRAFAVVPGRQVRRLGPRWPRQGALCDCGRDRHRIDAEADARRDGGHGGREHAGDRVRSGRAWRPAQRRRARRQGGASVGGVDLSVPVTGAASVDDADAVIALWRACGLTRPWNDPASDYALAMATATSTVLVARDGNAIAASVMVGFDGHRGWVYYLAVAPERQREGLGRTMMTAAEGWLRERGVPKIQLMVREDNDAALGFYAALGLERQKVVTLGRFLGKEDE
ncbi:GNAT family acetyltransferase [Sphingomonas sp. G-3-2-10]|nr:GNAT family acetyltransferase [Sphingomonas sp. G-3-2-10]